MKIALFLALVLSLPATAAYSQASADASAQSKAGASAMHAANVSAELTQKIDSKNAKVGDEVIARTTANAQLQETNLPRGTRLMGKVTEVHARSHEQHDGRLAFTFDRAVLRDGREIPIHAMLHSISAPSAAAMVDASDDFATGGGPVAATGRGSAHAGGLLGGGSGPIAQSGGLVTSAASTAGNASGHVVGAADATLRTSAGVVSQTGASATAVVYNLPGVTATGFASSSAMLEASGRNVELSGGTQLVLGVSENQIPAN